MKRVDKHGHDIEYNFKDPEHPLQLVFVCAMWLTGFDAPTLSTLYLDKPMKDHTLMQTIARANRVTPFKINNVTKKQRRDRRLLQCVSKHEKGVERLCPGRRGAG